jgi:hypothetical protein
MTGRTFQRGAQGVQLLPPNTPAVDRDLAAWIQGGGLSAGLWLRDLRAVDDPQPGAIGLLAQDLQANVGVVDVGGTSEK